ncbi:MAG: hypothetical protein OES09_06175 [Gammaproteobacteria bacterium]|nr:hypothetical protein [Gammaproteobacteria bacterium]
MTISSPPWCNIRAFQIGLSCMHEDCCFSAAVGYLVIALRTDPRFGPESYGEMNDVTHDSSGRYTRAILAVSSRLKKPAPSSG